MLTIKCRTCAWQLTSPSCSRLYKPHVAHPTQAPPRLQSRAKHGQTSWKKLEIVLQNKMFMVNDHNTWLLSLLKFWNLTILTRYYWNVLIWHIGGESHFIYKLSLVNVTNTNRISTLFIQHEKSVQNVQFHRDILSLDKIVSSSHHHLHGLHDHGHLGRLHVKVHGCIHWDVLGNLHWKF